MYRDKITNDPEETKNQIISFLEKKYGKEFVPLSIEMDCWPYHYDDLWVYPKGGDKAKEGFDAYRKRKNCKYVFEDCYFGVLIKDEYEKKINDIAKEIFPECQITAFFEGDRFSNELTSNSTLQDAIDKGEEIDPTIKIKVAPTFNNAKEFDENVDLFIQKMIENKLQGSILVFYLWDNNFNTEYINNTSFQKRRSINIYSDFSIKEFE